jgi:hypothetical protein
MASVAAASAAGRANPSKSAQLFRCPVLSVTCSECSAPPVRASCMQPRGKYSVSPACSVTSSIGGGSCAALRLGLLKRGLASAALRGA